MNAATRPRKATGGGTPLPALARDGETVFIDYLHHTAHGNELAGRHIYETLRDTFRRRAQALR